MSLFSLMAKRLLLSLYLLPFYIWSYVCKLSSQTLELSLSSSSLRPSLNPQCVKSSLSSENVPSILSHSQMLPIHSWATDYSEGRSAFAVLISFSLMPQLIMLWFWVSNPLKPPSGPINEFWIAKSCSCSLAYTLPKVTLLFTFKTLSFPVCYITAILLLLLLYLFYHLLSESFLFHSHIVFFNLYLLSIELFPFKSLQILPHFLPRLPKLVSVTQT